MPRHLISPSNYPNQIDDFLADDELNPDKPKSAFLDSFFTDLNTVDTLYLNNWEKLAHKNFYFGLEGKTCLVRICCFFINGLTKLDTLANMASEAFSGLLKFLLLGILLKPIDLAVGFVDRVQPKTITLLNFIPSLISVLGIIAGSIIIGVTSIAILVTSYALNLGLRLITTALGLIVTPFNLTYNCIVNSKTPYQTAFMATSAITAGAASALWIAIAAGAMTPAVLGTSAIATVLIAAAWPAAIATAATAGVLLSGVGLYNLVQYCKNSDKDKVNEAIRDEYSHADFEPKLV